MRRAEREVTDIAEIESLLKRAQVCRIALIDGDFPYIVPMCFGYSLNAGKPELYFHCATKGRKIDLIKKSGKAAFEIDEMREILPSEIPCGYSAAYESITGVGTIEVITGIEKITGLNTIMKKYAEGVRDNKYTEQMLNNVAILKLTVTEFSCKAHK